MLCVRPRVEFATCWSQVRCPNHCTTKPPCVTFLSMSTSPQHPCHLLRHAVCVGLSLYSMFHCQTAGRHLPQTACRPPGRSLHTRCCSSWLSGKCTYHGCVNIRPELDVFVCFCQWPEAMILCRVRMVNQVLWRSHDVWLVDNHCAMCCLTD